MCADLRQKQRIRILLVDNPITSLFMAAWYRQRDYHKDLSCRTVAVYAAIDYDDDTEEKKIIYKKASSGILEDIVNEWYVCMPAKYESFYSTSFRKPVEIIRKRLDRKADIKRIVELLNDHGIDADEVSEVWSANCVFLPHFRFICKKASIISFEHGLSDLKNAVVYNQSAERNDMGTNRLSNLAFSNLHRAKRAIKRKLDRLLIFYTMEVTIDKHISMFSKELAITNPHLNVESIESDAVSNLSLSIMRQDPGYSFFTKLDGNSAIILLTPIEPFTSERHEQFRFFKSFEEYLIRHWSDFLIKNEIRNIIFKSRFVLEVCTKEAVENFSSLNKLFNVVLLSDISPYNYNVEYYISTIRPKIIMGAYSSGLLYSKKIDPGLLTLSYDDWFIDYCENRFGWTSDYVWPRAFCESNKMIAFRAFLPQEL